MKCGYRMLLMILVLAFAGTRCQDVKTKDTRVVFRVSNEGRFYFQPEDKSGYEEVVPDSLGNTIFTVGLKEPGYYRYTSTKQCFYSVYLVPGAQMEICEDVDGVTFKGDFAAENTFLAENPFTAVVPREIPTYSAEWMKINREELGRILEKLNKSGLSSEFIQLQTLKYQYGFYNQLLEGPELMAMFLKVDVNLPDNYYDFLKDLKFDDPLITRLPKWFKTMLAAFERMEKEGMIEVSPDKYMEIYAGRIENEKVRSLFLINLLKFTLDKGYSDELPAYVKNVRHLITDSVAIAQLPLIETRYQQARESNKSILRGMPAPEFKAVDINGKEYTSDQFKGKIQVLDFWFTGCVPCRAEMPYMEKLSEEMKGMPVVFVSMSLDVGDELIGLWKQMIQDKKGAEYCLNVPGGFKSDLVKAYLIHSVPRIVIIDKEGKIVDAYAKRPSDPKLKMQLLELMK